MSGPILLAVRIMLALALYTFLGSVIWLLWRDLRRFGMQTARPQSPPLSLSGELGEQSFARTFTVTEIKIGRDPASDLRLDDPTVSAQHPRLFYRQGQWWVEDLRSTNGTFLNQERVSAPFVLARGDLIRFGQVSLEVTTKE